MRPDLTACAPDRVQLLAEFASVSPAITAERVEWLVARTADVVRRISTGDPHQRQDVHLEWFCEAPAHRSWRGPGAKELVPELDRFQRGMARAAESAGTVTWTRHEPDTVLEIRIDLDLNRGRPQAVIEVVFDTDARQVVVPGIEGAMLNLAKEVAARSDVAYLNLSDDNTMGETALDTVQPRRTPTREVAPGMLRSYSWVTRLTDQQLESLGGLEALRRSGAFIKLHRVRGGCVAQATEHLADYVGTRVRAVREALQPIIPADPTRKHDHFRLAWDDGENGPHLAPRGNRVWKSAPRSPKSLRASEVSP